MKTLNFVLVRSSVILTLLVAAVAIASPEQTITKLADLGPTTGQEIHHGIQFRSGAMRILETATTRGRSQNAGCL